MSHVVIRRGIHKKKKKKKPNRLSGLKIGGSGSEDAQAAKFMGVKYAEDTTIVLES